MPLWVSGLPFQACGAVTFWIGVSPFLCYDCGARFAAGLSSTATTRISTKGFFRLLLVTNIARQHLTLQ
jgi:hypothetical protein